MKIFISYSNKDREEVSRIAEMLINAGYAVWFDYNSIQAGNTWIDRVWPSSIEKILNDAP